MSFDYTLYHPNYKITGLTYDFENSEGPNIVFKAGEIFDGTNLYALPSGLQAPKSVLSTSAYNLVFFNTSTQSLEVLQDLVANLGNCSDGKLVINPNYLLNKVLLGGIAYVNHAFVFEPKVLVYYDLTDDIANFAKDIKETYLCTGTATTDPLTVNDLIGLVNNTNLEAVLRNMVCCSTTNTSLGTKPSWQYDPNDLSSTQDFIHLQDIQAKSVNYIKIPTLQYLRTILPTYTDEELIKGYWLLKYMPSVFYSNIVTETIQEA